MDRISHASGLRLGRSPSPYPWPGGASACERAPPEHGGGVTFPAALLSDPVEQAALDRDGYVVVDLADPLDAGLASEWTTREDPGMGNTCEATTAVRRRVRSALLDAFTPTMSRTFTDVTVLSANLVVKGPLTSAPMDDHVDWAFVDEEHHRSASLWCPFGAVDQASGALWVVPGSHRLMPRVRGSGSDPSESFPSPQAVAELLGRHHLGRQLLPLHPGQAVVFSHRLVHGSSPNLTSRPRCAAVLAVIPRSAQPVHYRCVKGSVHHAPVDTETFLTFRMDRPVIP